MSKISFNPSELKIFTKTQSNDASANKQTNPFGMSFKGKVLNSDVFESSQKNDNDNIASKGKLALCAAASVITTTKNYIGKTYASMIAFTSHLNNTVKVISDNVKLNIPKMIDSFGGNSYLNRPVSELQELLVMHEEKLQTPATV